MSEGGWLVPLHLARVEGGSMVPTLRGGDLLLCRRAAGGEVRPGQVVVVERPDRPGLLVVKRAVHRDRGGWWVEGDDGEHSHDSWVFGPVPDDLVRSRVLLRLWPRPRRP
jgi:nickel-type superoxide dismutase maturation protease